MYICIWNVPIYIYIYIHTWEMTSPGSNVGIPGGYFTMVCVFVCVCNMCACWSRERHINTQVHAQIQYWSMSINTVGILGGYCRCGCVDVGALVCVCVCACVRVCESELACIWHFPPYPRTCTPRQQQTRQIHTYPRVSLFVPNALVVHNALVFLYTSTWFCATTVQQWKYRVVTKNSICTQRVSLFVYIHSSGDVGLFVYIHAHVHEDNNRQDKSTRIHGSVYLHTTR